MHSCIHATYEHRLNICPLALSDVAFLIETHRIDWQVFVNTVNSRNWERCVLPLLYLAKRHLGAKIPEGVFDALGDDKNIASWFDAAEYLLFANPDDYNALNSKVQEVLYTGGAYARLSTFFGMIFPPRTAISLYFSVNADSSAIYLYYPMRWHYLLRKKLPLLLQALAGRRGALRQLAIHRDTLGGWLHENTEKTK